MWAQIFPQLPIKKTFSELMLVNGALFIVFVLGPQQAWHSGLPNSSKRVTCHPQLFLEYKSNLMVELVGKARFCASRTLTKLCTTWTLCGRSTWLFLFHFLPNYQWDNSTTCGCLLVFTVKCTESISCILAFRVITVHHVHPVLFGHQGWQQAMADVLPERPWRSNQSFAIIPRKHIGKMRFLCRNEKSLEELRPTHNVDKHSYDCFFFVSVLQFCHVAVHTGFKWKYIHKHRHDTWIQPDITPTSTHLF